MREQNRLHAVMADQQNGIVVGVQHLIVEPLPQVAVLLHQLIKLLLLGAPEEDMVSFYVPLLYASQNNIAGTDPIQEDGVMLDQQHGGLIFKQKSLQLHA